MSTVRILPGNWKAGLPAGIAALSVALLAWLAPASPARAAGAQVTIDATGAGCGAVVGNGAFGRWDAASKTCTMLEDVSLKPGDSNDAIEITGGGITLDGAGHLLTGQNPTGGLVGTGVRVNGHTGFTVRNLTISQFYYGISLENIPMGSPLAEVTANNLSSTVSGIRVDASQSIDIERNNSSLNQYHGIELGNASANVQLLGNTFDNNTLDGVYASNSSSLTITDNEASQNGLSGISLNSSQGSVGENSVKSNNLNGVELISSSGSIVQGNIIQGNGYASTGFGVYLNNSGSNTIIRNNFIDNRAQAQADGASSGNSFNVTGQGGNYWSDFDSPATGCHNILGNDSFCDSPYTATGVQDNQAWTLRNGWSSYYFTWYDNVDANDWVLMAQPNSTTATGYFDLFIANLQKDLPPLAGGLCASGCTPGQVPPGMTITPLYDGLIGGPVFAASRSGSKAIVSQRILWPRGGSSLEEVPGTDAQKLSGHFYWTWYDNQTPGYTNWILVANPNDYDVYYQIKIAGAVVDSGTIPANDKVTPKIDAPGQVKFGGPVEVEAAADQYFTEPARVMASQRVLSNYGGALNEVPGIPAGELSSDYFWTWYDDLGGTNWVLVANPDPARTMYYQIDLNGGCSASQPLPADKACLSGPIAAGGYTAPRLAGKMGGPLEVKTWSDAVNGSSPMNSIASQRSVWGPSFEEVPGFPHSALTNRYHWTWYDQATPGVVNWVLVANPALDINGSPASTVYYTIEIGSTVPASANCVALPPGTNATPTFSGQMNGPVELSVYSDSGCQTPAPAGNGVIASQRVLWKGYFNEVLGTVLN